MVEGRGKSYPSRIQSLEGRYQSCRLSNDCIRLGRVGAALETIGEKVGEVYSQCDA
jgi:hypothetical protein